jgi:ribosomal protein S12 methylthiotransferase
MKVGFVSLGCSKNLVDSEVMLGHLTRRAPPSSPVEEAEVL